MLCLLSDQSVFVVFMDFNWLIGPGFIFESCR